MSTKPSRIEVRHPGGTYDYWVGHDLLGSHRELAGIEGPTAIVTDETTAGQYLGTCGEADLVVVLPSGRLEKTLATVQKVHRKLLDARLDRSTTLISLGDSIIGDVTAFAAATYLRGIDVVHIPTELIAMIDTSVGGKVGLDVPHGRNLIGLFKQPRAVIADVTTLRSLSPNAFSAGMSEVVKHALITGEDMTRRIESSEWDSVESTTGGSTDDLEDLIARAVQVKVDIVAEDPFDEARRQVLNLGHTFVYAFESACSAMSAMARPSGSAWSPRRSCPPMSACAIQDSTIVCSTSFDMSANKRRCRDPSPWTRLTAPSPTTRSAGARSSASYCWNASGRRS